MASLKNQIKNSSELVSVFSALGDQTRFNLLEILMEKEDYCVSELASEVGISNAGVSQQLKILEQAGLINRVRDGQKICYQINKSSDLNNQLLTIVK